VYRSNGSIKNLLCCESEKPILEGLYVDFGVPTDQLRRCPDVLRAIVGSFNSLTGNAFDAPTLLRYMFNRRKDGDWPRLGATARRFHSPADELSEAEIEALKAVYLEIDSTSDELQFNPGLLRTISRRFRETTGRTVSGSVLVAVILAKRKRGDWPTIRLLEASAFTDLDQAANM